MTDIVEIARAAGMTVLLDGQIGRQQYQSVTGSLASLHRFADAYWTPEESDLGRLAERLKNRAALQIDDTDAQLMRDAARAIAQRHYTNLAQEAAAVAAIVG
ncbi:hypothetical protein [Paraburkholderia sp. BL23I1N1]|uniref:hypothetical protein n=1 Tax=Paraburkholderia sp. BL23I1N1 TaxID=1938802 RepID=UPI001601A4D1|nr:hypothetical protein [Paraburkholderia sp. BL23I1N1]